MGKEAPFCRECGRPAVWVRFTQFPGNRRLCARHAEEQEDFGKDDPYFLAKQKTWNAQRISR